MVSRLCSKVLALTALVSSGPAFAQESAPHAAADTLAIAMPAPEFVAKAAIVMAQGEFIQPELDPFLSPGAGGVSLESPKGPIQHFVDRTTQPVVRLTRQSGEWLISNASAAALMAQNASQWVAANANAAVSVARDSGGWIASSGDAAALMAQNACQWVAAQANAAVSAAQASGDWIASNANAAALAAQNASDWVAVNANAAVSAAQASGDWIALNANAATAAAQNAGQWVTVNANAAVSAAQETGDWIVFNTKVAVNSAVGTADNIRELMAVEDWSAALVREVANHWRVNRESEFANLIRESGFVLMNIKVGVDLLPELDVEFRHERNLEPDEIAAFRGKVQEYGKKYSGPVGYLEALVLRRLLKAGEYSGDLRISEVHIDLLPVPGLEVFFDPLNYETEQDQMLSEAYEMAKVEGKELKNIHERILKLESMLARPKSR
jgi:hypothetical protein